MSQSYMSKPSPIHKKLVEESADTVANISRDSEDWNIRSIQSTFHFVIYDSSQKNYTENLKQENSEKCLPSIQL
jgi:hypothetical protein